MIVIYAIIKLAYDKRKYKMLEYNFYSTKLEYIDDTIQMEKRELKYYEIREITMSQSVLEKLLNIGTIKIYINSSNEQKNKIFIHSIKNVQNYYDKIKDTINSVVM